jgi:hypothetical protein
VADSTNYAEVFTEETEEVRMKKVKKAEGAE